VEKEQAPEPKAACARWERIEDKEIQKENKIPEEVEVRKVRENVRGLRASGKAGGRETMLV